MRDLDPIFLEKRIEALENGGGSDIKKNLVANNKPFVFDYQNGEYGYNTDENRGADTFHPFRSGLKLLWENADKDMSFEAQIVTLDLTKYEYIAIESAFSVGAGDKSYSTDRTVIMPVNEDNKAISISTHGFFSTRDISFNNGVVFGVGTVNNANDNNYCVPLRIYGV